MILVKIRMKRMGRKKAPFYRIVVAESHIRRDGKVIEEIGYYSPCASENEKQLKEFEMDLEKYNAWLAKGAQASETVQKIAKKLQSN